MLVSTPSKKTGGLRRSKVLLPTCPSWWHLAHLD